MKVVGLTEAAGPAIRGVSSCNSHHADILCAPRGALVGRKYKVVGAPRGLTEHVPRVKVMSTLKLASNHWRLRVSTDVWLPNEHVKVQNTRKCCIRMLA